MSRAIASLLGRSNDRLFLKTIEELELATGNTGIDAKLLGDILQHSHKTIQKLRLDSADSTPLEVYNVLRLNLSKIRSSDKNSYACLMVRGRCISLNIDDLTRDEKSSSKFNDRSLDYVRKSLLTEIKNRYQKAAGDHNRVVKRLLSSL
ncbi:hypothetical protein GX865_01550 [Candidatus Saccharibacteria bacterium]|jgi:hypothetical protein|nr:hypothetical protein [Candidatus Saccharibacteria bacterium]